ncbi:MAG TPA: bifunctional adenosylcobinamide kinase/adenosylcobinamide-phosphate guanylyltransferase [Candidatus Evtepia faecigallinarum]|nr:bifunctional adenosylcobinamide kinase/adenosylcobinamide-phosphate guanylyltransferase [Candidatus Evtepia faecigallinarum]
MIFVTGPLFAGKREYICSALGWTEEDLARRAIWDVQDLAADAPDLEALAQDLSRHEVVIATEIGGGVVPTDPAQRQAREAAGRLSCLLAQRARRVIRVVCGLPQAMKGELL